MITQLRGRIADIEQNWLVLDVGGVGYQLFASSRTLAQIGQPGDEVLVRTELLVREDALTLYGFATARERAAFRLLQTVQGVGARAALSVLSTLSPDEISTAILAADKAMIARADGVGPKLALRIVTELAQKTGAMMTAPGALPAATAGGAGVSADISDTAVYDALSALVNLGYSRSEAFAAVTRTAAQADGNELSALIAGALRQLGQERT